MSYKLKCAVLGATGPVGQKLLHYLENHSKIEVAALGAFTSTGIAYKEAIKGREYFEQMDCTPPIDRIMDMVVHKVDELAPEKFDIAFSCLREGVDAKPIEKKWARYIPVFSAASGFRMEADTPILVPGINSDHSRLLNIQRKNRGWKGLVCPKCNCTTYNLIPVKAFQKYEIEEVEVFTEQALSGAGEKGLNQNSEYRKLVKKQGRLLYIEGEKEKVENELKKILGVLSEDSIIPADFPIHAWCTRVDRENVHVTHIKVKTKKHTSLYEIRKNMLELKSNLPSAPKSLIVEVEKFEPEQHVSKYGAKISVANLMQLGEKELRFSTACDNTGPGASLGLVWNLEELLRQEII